MSYCFRESRGMSQRCGLSSYVFFTYMGGVIREVYDRMQETEHEWPSSESASL